MSASPPPGLACDFVRDVFHLPNWFRQIEELNYQVPADTVPDSDG